MKDFSIHDFSLINVGMAKHNADWNWQDVCSPFARIFHVLSGEARVDFEGSSQTLRPGFLYLIPPFVKHSYHCEGVFELVYVHLYEIVRHGSGESAYSDLRSQLFACHDFPVCVEACAADHALLQRLCLLYPDLELHHSNPRTYDNSSAFISTIRKRLSHDGGDRMEASGILLILMSRFMKEAVAKSICSNDRMVKAIAYINRNMDKAISTDDVARLICVSKNHCIRLFRSEFGQTTVQYICGKKMERAQLLLATTDISIKSISASLGYDNYAYFTHLFHKKVGMTPVAFRNHEW